MLWFHICYTFFRCVALFQWYSHCPSAQFESRKLKEFLLKNGIAKSRTSPFRHQRNGQREKINGPIQKVVQLTRRTYDFVKTRWQEELLVAISSLRSLLCTATNCILHYWIFAFQRSSVIGSDLPNYLLNPSGDILHHKPIYLKSDIPAKKVKLMEKSSPYFARVEFQSARIDTVSTKNLAPYLRCIWILGKALRWKMSSGKLILALWATFQRPFQWLWWYVPNELLSILPSCSSKRHISTGNESDEVSCKEFMVKCSVRLLRGWEPLWETDERHRLTVLNLTERCSYSCLRHIDNQLIGKGVWINVAQRRIVWKKIFFVLKYRTASWSPKICDTIFEKVQEVK